MDELGRIPARPTVRRINPESPEHQTSLVVLKMPPVAQPGDFVDVIESLTERWLAWRASRDGDARMLADSEGGPKRHGTRSILRDPSKS